MKLKAPRLNEAMAREKGWVIFDEHTDACYDPKTGTWYLDNWDGTRRLSKENYDNLPAALNAWMNQRVEWEVF